MTYAVANLLWTMDVARSLGAVYVWVVVGFSGVDRFSSLLQSPDTRHVSGTEAVRKTTVRRTCQHQRVPQPPTHRQPQENRLHSGSMYSASRSHTHHHSSRVWHSSERHPIDGRGRRRQIKLKPKEVARRTQLASYHLVFQYCTLFYKLRSTQ